MSDFNFGMARIPITKITKYDWLHRENLDMNELEIYKDVLSESQYKRLVAAKESNDQNEFKHWERVAKCRLARKDV